MRKIRIPSLDEMFEDVKNAVQEAQGDKGFIDTDPRRPNGTPGDTIFTYKFNEESGNYEEEIVFGVRVEEDDLQVISNPAMRTYHNRPDDEEFKDDENWYSVRSSDDILYIPTIFNLAENIGGYIG